MKTFRLIALIALAALAACADPITAPSPDVAAREVMMEDGQGLMGGGTKSQP